MEGKLVAAGVGVVARQKASVAGERRRPSVMAVIFVAAGGARFDPVEVLAGEQFVQVEPESQIAPAVEDGVMPVQTVTKVSAWSRKSLRRQRISPESELGRRSSAR
nr:hypothetical protein [uncultured bacterium]